MYPDFSGPPRALQKDTCAAKGSYTPAGFLFVSYPECALGAREKGKRTYLAALRGRPRGPAAGEGAPRSHSPPGRSPHGPSLPPRRRTPPSQLSRKRDELPVRAPDTSSSARARISSLRADAQRNPEARQFRRGATRPRGSASRRYAAAPVARPDLGPGASFSTQVPAFPRSRLS